MLRAACAFVLMTLPARADDMDRALTAWLADDDATP